MVIPFALCIAIAASSIAATPRDTSKVVLISWDGAPNWVIRDMVRDGKLPGLACIMADGFRSDGMQPAYPSKTAVGHASIFTGTWPDIHGVSNNAVPLLPRSENGPDKTIRGFDSAALQVEPLIVTAARQGKRVISLSTTQSYPADKWVKQLAPLGMEKKLSIYSGFESQISKNTVLDASRFKPVSLWKDVRHAGSTQPLGSAIELGETRVELLLVDDPSDSTKGFDTVLVRTDASGTAQAIKAKAASGELTAWSKPIAVRKGDKELADKISNAIDAIRANGKYKELQDKYFDFNVYASLIFLVNAPFWIAWTIRRFADHQEAAAHSSKPAPAGRCAPATKVGAAT